MFKLHRAIAASILVFGINTSAQATAVAIQTWDGGDNLLEAGSIISVTGSAGNNSAYTDNLNLNYSAWAHTGNWWNFQVADTSTTVITVAGTAGDFVPGVSVYASGASAFNGGTTGFGAEFSTAGFGTPHSFNATGALGDAGTLWMASGFGGNMLETLAYGVANTDVSYHAGATGWGEHIHAGTHDVSLTDVFEGGISGSIDDNLVELVFTDLQAGWYTLFIGGTDHDSIGGLYDITVSAVPVPAALYLLAPAVLGLIGFGRNKRTA